MPDLATTDPRLFAEASSLLREFAESSHLLTQNFGVAVAVLLHRNAGNPSRRGPPGHLHSPTGAALSTGALQRDVCDPTYAKDEAFWPREAEGPIYKPFTNHFKGVSPGVNNWRNSYDLQSGLGCDAPFTDTYLLSDEYLAEPRFHCIFRDADTGACESPSGLSQNERTCFNPNKRGDPPGPDTRALPRPKLLSRGYIDGIKTGYWVVEPTVEVLNDLLADPAERVPAYPFAVALYGGSAYFARWGGVASPDRLQLDTQLDDERFSAIFDISEDNDFNRRVFAAAKVRVRRLPRSFSEIPANSRILSKPVAYLDRPASTIRPRALRVADPEKRARLLERATEGHRKTLHKVAVTMQRLGYDCKEQLDGFDLLARIGKQEVHLFEIKTWRPENLAKQTRSGLAQLLEYRYRNPDEMPAGTPLYLCFDRKPPHDHWLWDFLTRVCGVTPCWVDDTGIRTRAEVLFELRARPRSRRRS
jgi:hypothetical protein